MSYRKDIPENEGNFTTFNNTGVPVIKPRKIMNEMKKSEVGREALKYIEDEGVPVSLVSGVVNDRDIYGYYDSLNDEIVVYCDKCRDKVEAAKTVIHEATHRRLRGEGRSAFEEEVECFSTEYLHDHESLTPSAEESIIKMVRDNYEFDE